MLNTVIVFFMGYAIGYFFGQQREKEKYQAKQNPVNNNIKDNGRTK